MGRELKKENGVDAEELAEKDNTISDLLMKLNIQNQ